MGRGWGTVVIRKSSLLAQNIACAPPARMFDTSGCLCNTRSCCPSSAPAQDLSVPKWRNWQTRMVQVHVPARVWGFESLLRHQFSQRALFSVLWFREDTLALLWQYKSGDRHLRQKEVFLMANTKVLLLRYCRLD